MVGDSGKLSLPKILLYPSLPMRGNRQGSSMGGARCRVPLRFTGNARGQELASRGCLLAKKPLNN